MPSLRVSHPSQDALDVLYYLYFMNDRDEDGTWEGPMYWVEDHRPELFVFISDLCGDAMESGSEEPGYWEGTDDRTYWRIALTRAIDELA